MKSRALLAIAIVGATLFCLLNQSSNNAQVPDAPKPPKYEYTVREFYSPWERNGQADEFTRVINQLAESGWDYVGPIAENSLFAGVDRNRVNTKTYVAFRRPVSNLP